jgi:hypothetical protein
MGARAIQFFNDLGIDTILGISGALEKIKKDLAENSLKGGVSSCNPKSGRGYGLDRQGGCHHS